MAAPNTPEWIALKETVDNEPDFAKKVILQANFSAGVAAIERGDADAIPEPILELPLAPSKVSAGG